MKTEHTPEPWATNGTRIESEHNHGWVNDGWIIGGLDGPDAKANASRIVACVNACAGISTENLEDNKPLIELAMAYNVALRQRDELLAALLLASCCLEPNTSTATVNQIEAAIASVKEQK